MRGALPIPGPVKPLVPLVSWMTARYISYHRRRLVEGSSVLSSDAQARLQDFFPRPLLTETRIIQAVMPEPILYPLVKVLGIKGLLPMSSIGAITLVDVVAYAERMDGDLLFHELVHVVQYHVLGLKRFAELYVKGFLAGGGYAGIPLERQAYELGARFEQHPGKAFSVEEDVIRRHAAGLL